MILTLLVVASGNKAADKEEVKKDAKKAEKPEMVKQTHCPVMGGEIDSTAYTDIQGQRVYHCCPMCSKKLTDDPDKYFKEAAANHIVFENIQKTCPVSGNELSDKAHELYFEGRRLYFCSDSCVTKFSKEPQTYLKKMSEEKK